MSILGVEAGGFTTASFQNRCCTNPLALLLVTNSTDKKAWVLLVLVIRIGFVANRIGFVARVFSVDEKDVDWVAQTQA